MPYCYVKNSWKILHMLHLLWLKIVRRLEMKILS
jgi:hypothetical protein